MPAESPRVVYIDTSADDVHLTATRYACIRDHEEGLRDRLFSFRINQARSTLTMLEFINEFDVVLRGLFPRARGHMHSMQTDTERRGICKS